MDNDVIVTFIIAKNQPHQAGAFSLSFSLYEPKEKKHRIKLSLPKTCIEDSVVKVVGISMKKHIREPNPQRSTCFQTLSLLCSKT